MTNQAGEPTARCFALVAGLALLGLLDVAACSGGGGTSSGAAGGRTRGHPASTRAASSSTWPSRPRRSTLLTDLAETFNALGRQGRRPLRVRARRPEVVRRRRHAAPEGWPEPGGQRASSPSSGRRPPAAGPPSSTRRSGARLAPGRDAVHAHAARHRHAQADGRGARLPGHADRLRRHRRPRQRSRRAGPSSAIPSGARSGSARPTPTSPPAASTSPIAEYYAATGKTSGLTVEDLARPGRRRLRRRASSRRSSTTATSR